ncbi:MAG: hypothetical protein LBC78_01960 [Oscillospiraceae bacterium]|jgi:penicillin-binding protein 2|nr:hypothetical protein [Oscillospiraceae bacterium]
MNKLFKRTRLAVVLTVFLGVLAVYAVTLYKLQIYDAAASGAAGDAPKTVSAVLRTVRASRGDILDRNGVLLVSSTPSYNVRLSWETLRAVPDMNEVVRDIIHMAAESGISYADTFPVTQGAPFEYKSSVSDTLKNRLAKYIDTFDLAPDISASELIVWMREHYKIPYTTSISDARLIIGVRYELETEILLKTAEYVFARNVDLEFIARLEEKSYPGVFVEPDSRREYHTSFAAHILGNVAPVDGGDKGDWEYFKALGYPRDARVGKSGVELAFEKELHGVDGHEIVYLAADGTVISRKEEAAPQPGGNVYLTIDIRLQEAAERALEQKIADINLEREADQLATGGAVAAVSVKTGETLVLASYPTYNLATLMENIADLSADITAPMYNRATLGTYAPGSTFKMVTAYAGLVGGVISRWSTINDTGIFTKYQDVGFSPRCWIYTSTGHGHGPLDIIGAIQNSCNVYFYEVADRVSQSQDGNNPNNLNAAAADFGFGAVTGLEIYESEGLLADREWKVREKKEGWRSGDSVLLGIGQGFSSCTPIQLANYTATIASGGTRYKTTLLKSVKSADFSENIKEMTPTVAQELGNAEYISYLQTGMRAVATDGTAKTVFSKYSVPVAAKTGTVQQTTSEINNGVFVCYAPADDPEIAIAVVVEKGGSGAAIMEVAKAVLDAYFLREVNFDVVGDGRLVP